MKKRDWKIALISAGATLGVVLLIVLVLHYFSFKIVYDPAVITNWDAVSGVASWVSTFVSMAAVAASIVALVYAIRVPKEIADRQDKIALFEKRSEIYAEIKKYYALIRCLTPDGDAEKNRIAESVILHLWGLKDFSPGEIEAFSYKSSLNLMQIPFLFPGVGEDDIIILAGTIHDLVSYYAQDSDKNDMCKKNYKKHVLSFYEKYDALFHQYIQIDVSK